MDIACPEAGRQPTIQATCPPLKTPDGNSNRPDVSNLTPRCPMNNRLVSIDPGLRTAGVAEFDDGELVKCKAISHNLASGPPQWVGMARRIVEWVGDPPDKLAIERMETRPERKGVHDDLFKLTYISGGIYYGLGESRRLIAVRPRDWTHQRPKKVNHRRVRKRLDNNESDVLEGELSTTLSGDQKEILDAVAIGLHVLNRLG